MIVVILLIAVTFMISVFALLYFSQPKLKTTVEAPKYQILNQEDRKRSTH